MKAHWQLNSVCSSHYNPYNQSDGYVKAIESLLLPKIHNTVQTYSLQLNCGYRKDLDKDVYAMVKMVIF